MSIFIYGSGWRPTRDSGVSPSDFIRFLADFDPEGLIRFIRTSYDSAKIIDIPCNGFGLVKCTWTTSMPDIDNIKYIASKLNGVDLLFLTSRSAVASAENKSPNDGDIIAYMLRIIDYSGNDKPVMISSNTYIKNWKIYVHATETSDACLGYIEKNKWYILYTRYNRKACIIDSNLSKWSCVDVNLPCFNSALVASFCQYSPTGGYICSHDTYAFMEVDWFLWSVSNP